MKNSKKFEDQVYLEQKRQIIFNKIRNKDNLTYDDLNRIDMYDILDALGYVAVRGGDGLHIPVVPIFSKKDSEK